MPENKSVSDRVKEYRDFKKFKKREFEVMCGLSNGYLNSVNTPSSEKLEQIIRVCSDLNRDWLMTGNGEMTIASQKEETNNTTNINKTNAEDDEMTSKLIASQEIAISSLRRTNEILEKELLERDREIADLKMELESLKQRAV